MYQFIRENKEVELRTLCQLNGISAGPARIILLTTVHPLSQTRHLLTPRTFSQLYTSSRTSEELFYGAETIAHREPSLQHDVTRPSPPPPPSVLPVTQSGPIATVGSRPAPRTGRSERPPRCGAPSAPPLRSSRRQRGPVPPRPPAEGPAVRHAETPTHPSPPPGPVLTEPVGAGAGEHGGGPAAAQPRRAPVAEPPEAGQTPRNRGGPRDARVRRPRRAKRRRQRAGSAPYRDRREGKAAAGAGSRAGARWSGPRGQDRGEGRSVRRRGSRDRGSGVVRATGSFARSGGVLSLL